MSPLGGWLDDSQPTLYAAIASPNDAGYESKSQDKSEALRTLDAATADAVLAAATAGDLRESDDDPSAAIAADVSRLDNTWLPLDDDLLAGVSL